MKILAAIEHSACAENLTFSLCQMTGIDAQHELVLVHIVPPVPRVIVEIMPANFLWRIYKSFHEEARFVLMEMAASVRAKRPETIVNEFVIEGPPGE